MVHKGWLIAIIVITILIAAAAYWLVPRGIGAVGGPGPLETSVASKVRGWYISRAAKRIPTSTIANNAASISQGEALYGMACAFCHGQDGRKSSPIGKSMHPRVPSLISPAVKGLSDKEVFWVIKNGIRLSGMPGFANVESDEEIWQITYYVRSLGPPAKR